MKNLNELTVIILTYNTSKKIILDCLNSINKEVNILIIENSKNFSHEKIINLEFPSVKIICTGENLGYGGGNNFGIKHTKTDYALIINPDVICDRNFFSNIISVSKKAENFSIIGCQYSYDNIFMPAGFFDKKKNLNFVREFKNNNINSLSKVDWVTGCSMLINLNKFKHKEIFDEKFFLYFEEFDLCKSIIKIGENVYSSKNLKVHHLGFKSSLSENDIENQKKMNLKDWHYMWSSFYFYKKNYSYFYAIRKLFSRFIKSLIKTIFYTIMFNQKLKKKYLYRFLGLLSSMTGRPSDFRG